MYLMGVLFKDMPVMDKMMLFSHFKPDERSYICLTHT
jgi:hypothetical protein